MPFQMQDETEVPVNWKNISHTQAASFLKRCARVPNRFFYPCNAAHRPAAHCSFTFTQNRHGQKLVVRVPILECEWQQGGTGWRVWPCALLLSCWIARHHQHVKLTHSRVLELGCGLGLPGLAAAALGAKSVTLTDCLPRLLETVRRSALINVSSKIIQVSQLDWDVEVPLECVEDFSTEQGVKLEQENLQDDHQPLDPSTQFDLIVASDVVYSMRHAQQLPRVIIRRAEHGARVCMLVPVRSLDHTREFLGGLRKSGFTVATARVDEAWISALFDEETPCEPFTDGKSLSQASDSCLREGEILFVIANLGS